MDARFDSLQISDDDMRRDYDTDFDGDLDDQTTD
jgi:hypothetical protein